MASDSVIISPLSYFSTHNVLGCQQAQDNPVLIFLKELEGTRHTFLSVYPFYDVQILKRILIKQLKLASNVKVTDIRIVYKGVELPNYRSISTFLNTLDENRRDILKFFWCFRTFNDNVGIRNLDVINSPLITCLISDILLGFKNNIAPKLAMEGTGGTYFLYNKKRRICAIFKPVDEEAFAPCNPRGYHGKLSQRGFRPGVLSGEGASREVAAYMLDSLYGNICQVPPTTLVEVRHSSLQNKEYFKIYDYAMSDKVKWKTGSLQAFIETREICGNFDPNLFSISDVHHIGIFDLCVLNLDRNDGNILVRNLKIGLKMDDTYKTPLGEYTRYSLIPIDHGMILPDVLDLSDFDLVWYGWPQTKIKFSPEELEYIRQLNPDRDAFKLKRKLLIRDECLRTMRVATRLVKIGAQNNLTLYQIASLAVRENLDDPSELELIISSAIKQAYLAFDSTRLVTTNRLKFACDLIQPQSHAYSAEKSQLSQYNSDYNTDTCSKNDISDSDYSDDLPPITNNEDQNGSANVGYSNKDIYISKAKSIGTFRQRKPFRGDFTIWSLYDDHGKPIQVEWSDPQFEYFFFQTLERLINDKITKIAF